MSCPIPFPKVLTPEESSTKAKNVGAEFVIPPETNCLSFMYNSIEGPKSSTTISSDIPPTIKLSFHPLASIFSDSFIA